MTSALIILSIDLMLSFGTDHVDSGVSHFDRCGTNHNLIAMAKEAVVMACKETCKVAKVGVSGSVMVVSAWHELGISLSSTSTVSIAFKA